MNHSQRRPFVISDALALRLTRPLDQNAVDVGLGNAKLLGLSCSLWSRVCVAQTSAVHALKCALTEQE